MHPSFSDWYRAVRIKPDPDELTRRWQVVERLSENLKLTDVLNLLRIATGLPQVIQGYQAELVKQIQELDATFSPRNNQQELSVLSGAMLLQCLLEENSQLSGQIGLAVVTANCQGKISAKLPHQVELTEKASEALATYTHWLRITDDFESNGDSLKGLDKASKTFVESVWGQNSAQQTNFDAVINLLKTAIKNQSKEAEKLRYDLRIQREEANILWWLHGEYSRDLDKPLAEFETKEAVIVIGKELADLIEFRPGPRSSQGVLYRMLQKASMLKNTKKSPEMLTLGDAIKATSRDWREQWISGSSGDSVIDLCPVYHAAKKSLQVAEGKAWAAAFDATSFIKTSQKFSPLELAMQVYQESQLIAEVNE